MKPVSSPLSFPQDNSLGVKSPLTAEAFVTGEHSLNVSTREGSKQILDLLKDFVEGGGGDSFVEFSISYMDWD